MKIFRKTRYINKEELLSMLNAETKVNALRVIVEKEFVPRLIKQLQEAPTMSNVYDEIDRYHAHILREIIKKSGNYSIVAAVNGVSQAYSLIVALMAHQIGLKPVTYVSLVDIESYQEMITNEKADKLLNPHIRSMLTKYYSQKHLKSDDVLRVLDKLRLMILELGTYRERVIAGLYFDGVMMRLCAFDELSELHFRTLLIERNDFESLRVLLKNDVNAAADVIRRAHPLLTLFSDALKDCLKVAHGIEVLDLVNIMVPAYVSALTLHVSERDVQLKHYFLFLRQAILLKIVLAIIEDSTLKDGLRVVIDRWVVP